MDRDTISQMVHEDDGDGSRTIPVISDLIEKWGQDPILSRDPRQSEIIQVMRMMAKKKGDDAFLKALDYLMDREKIMVLNIVQKQASTDAVLELLKERESKDDVDFEQVLCNMLGIDQDMLKSAKETNNELNDPGDDGKIKIKADQTPKTECKHLIKYSDQHITCGQDVEGPDGKSNCAIDPQTGDFYIYRDCQKYEPGDPDSPTRSIADGILDKALGTTDEGDEK